MPGLQHFGTVLSDYTHILVNTLWKIAATITQDSSSHENKKKRKEIILSTRKPDQSAADTKDTAQIASNV